MANDGETVREVCKKILSSNYPTIRTEDGYDYLVGYLVRSNTERILAAYEREMAAKDSEIARLKAALKPVMECDENQHDKMLNALRAVREAQRVMLQSETAKATTEKKGMKR